MKFSSYLTITAMLFCMSVYAQTQNNSKVITALPKYASAKSRYGFEYSIKDSKSTPSDSVFSLLDANYRSYCLQRKQSERVEITDTATGLTLILFSEEEVIANKGKAPANTNLKSVTDVTEIKLSKKREQ